MEPTMTLISSAVLAALALCLGTAAQAADPRGRYLTASGNLEVQVADCGAALCGTVTRVIANHSMSRPGEAMPAAGARDPMGLALLTGFVPTEHAPAAAGGAPQPVQWRGEIYNRENGKTYSCLLSQDARGDLVVRPYVGLPLLGRTQVWQRLGDASASGGRP
jgi:uncharacterized protein (DUF2147 family)